MFIYNQMYLSDWYLQKMIKVKADICTKLKFNAWRVWRYTMSNQNLYIEEGQTTQWLNEKG
jgi:membrane protein YdbS with pleckstrin-like domain